MFKPDTTEFYVNEYSWNKESNVIYLESPGGIYKYYYKDTNFYIY